MRPPRPVPSLHAVLFDVDGTLVDSNPAHAAAWHKALVEYGHDVPKEAIRDWIGKGGDRLLPELTGVAEASREGRAISALRKQIFKERYLPQLRAFPGARELVARLRDLGLLIGVATSAARSEVDELLDIADVLDLVHHKTSGDDADSSKPAPDIVEATLDALGIEPHRALLVGDTPYDVEAGMRAGVPVVAVLTGRWHPRDLRGAMMIYRDLEDILDHFDASPFVPRVEWHPRSTRAARGHDRRAS